MENSEKPQPHGGRNLLILGILSIVISVITSGISLIIYHTSGDIYLDRSRPGYLPDKEENAPTSAYTYSYDENKEITNDSLDEYLKNLNNVLDQINNLTPYEADSLSDETLDI